MWKRVEKQQVGMRPLLFQERVIPSAVSLKEWLLDVACAPMNVWRTSVKLSQVFPGRQEGKIWKHMCEAEIIKPWLIMQVRKRAKICYYACPRHFLMKLLSALKFLVLLLILNSWNVNVANGSSVLERCLRDAVSQWKNMKNMIPDFKRIILTYERFVV